MSVKHRKFMFIVCGEDRKWTWTIWIVSWKLEILLCWCAWFV